MHRTQPMAKIPPPRVSPLFTKRKEKWRSFSSAEYLAVDWRRASIIDQKRIVDGGNWPAGYYLLQVSATRDRIERRVWS